MGVAFWPYPDPPQYTMESSVAVWNLNGSSATASGSQTAPQGGASTNIAAIVVPTVVGGLSLTAVVAGLLLYRRRRRQLHQLHDSCGSSASVAESGKAQWRGVGVGGGSRGTLERRLTPGLSSPRGKASSTSGTGSWSQGGPGASLAGETCPPAHTRQGARVRAGCSARASMPWPEHIPATAIPALPFLPSFPTTKTSGR